MDFDRFAEGTPEVDPKDPVALYATLPRKQSHVELRESQKELLRAWATRRGDRDVILKLATGAGKTTAGLVALYSHMVESKRPCVFLCPTNQLVAQVVDEGILCGVPTVAATGGSEIPPEALAGHAVLVTSVQNVFHSRAGHFTKANPYAILVDDAHSAVEVVRQQFRLTIPRADSLYKRLHALFKNALRDQSLGTAAEIENNQRSGGVEVPYWTWLDQREAVTELIAERVREDDEAYRKGKPSEAFGLAWGHLKNILYATRCVFSSAAIEVSPEVTPVERVAAYGRAERRIFMSATISDESVLVRELGCAPSAAESPIELPDAGGIGERMVLVPRLMAASASAAITWDDLSALCKKLAAKHSVVVLTPSYTAARRWGTVGARVIEKSEDVPGAVKGLREGKFKFVAFAFRYDGLDLPDEACRVLVLDGAPMAQSLVDGIDMVCKGASTTRMRAVMHRIEQGLGRAVRSAADYAVILLFGNDLVSLIAMSETRAELTEQTRRQIEFGLEIAKQVKQSGDWRKDIETLANQCLYLDAGWKRAYQKHAAPRPTPPADFEKRKMRIAQASAERRAWEKFVANQGGDAAKVIQDHLNAARPNDDVKAFLLQRAAWYLRKEDPAKSLEMQKFARERDPQLLLPPGIQYRKRVRASASSAAEFVAWLSQFDHPGAAIAQIEEWRAHLVFSPEAPSEKFEQALCDLGSALGFESSRPEREAKVGPDVLWMEGQYVAPLEAKNNIGPDTDAISKNDAAQLSQSTAWAAELHPERTQLVPMIAHPRARQGDAAFLPTNTRVLTPEHLGGVLDALQTAVGGVQRIGERFSVESAGQKLAELNLTLAGILTVRTARPE